jgi:hypothetical protein
MRQIIKDAKKIDALILYFETVVSTMKIESKGWYGDNVLLSESSEITPENFTDKFIVRLAKYRLEDYNEEGHSRNTKDADWRKQTKQLEIFIIKYQ